MKRVKLEQIMAGPSGAFPVGKEIDVDDEVADYLVDTRQAILVASDPEAEATGPDSVPEDPAHKEQAEDADEASDDGSPAIQNPKSKIQNPDSEDPAPKPVKKPKPKDS